MLFSNYRLRESIWKCVHHRVTCSHWIHQMYSTIISRCLFPSPLGKEMIEMYFDFRLFRLWKTRQHSKLLDYEDLLWPCADQRVALRAGRPTVKLHSTSFHFGEQEEDETGGDGHSHLSAIAASRALFISARLCGLRPPPNGNTQGTKTNSKWFKMQEKSRYVDVSVL